jgi:hypothetical protein
VLVTTSYQSRWPAFSFYFNPLALCLNIAAA